MIVFCSPKSIISFQQKKYSISILWVPLFSDVRFS